jgi:acetyltransferase-like isoleucine patch superfamily enzyme
MVPVLKVGDYVKVHNHTLINGRGRCAIGHNTWVGQNNILNAEDDLVIGNNVGFGIYSSIWTHAYYGELLEGCTISQVAPITVDDDVWLVGAYNAIAPGVHVGKRAVILNGSFVNKDVPPKHVVGGSPARDLTDHVVFYRNVSLEEKMSMMKQFTREFLEQYYPGFWLEATPDHVRVESEEQSFDILFWEQVEEGAAPPERYSLIITKRSNRRACANASVFDLEARTYTKRLCEPEIQLISFLNSHRARFVPYDHPKIELEEDD